MNVRISANLIALNEQRDIARCLHSLHWVDEIVVIDGGSIDATVQIARQFTDQVHVHPFDNYASQRNRALNRSTGDWVFSIDCDEVVPTELAGEVQRCVATASPHCHGYWVPIRSRIFGRQLRHCGTQGERKMRLFRRTSGYWQGAVHEIVRLAGDTASLRNAIEHESTPDLDTYLRKLVRYSSLECERVLQDGRCPSAWKRWLAPFWQFAKLYFGKRGFLDGPEGLRFCVLSAFEVWIMHQKVMERLRDRRNSRDPAWLNEASMEGAPHEPATVAA
jgi:glycosyltransferase involved in cell wall biosynthesis